MVVPQKWMFSKETKMGKNYKYHQNTSTLRVLTCPSILCNAFKEREKQNLSEGKSLLYKIAPLTGDKVPEPDGGQGDEGEVDGVEVGPVRLQLGEEDGGHEVDEDAGEQLERVGQLGGLLAVAELGPLLANHLLGLEGTAFLNLSLGCKHAFHSPRASTRDNNGKW